MLTRREMLKYGLLSGGTLFLPLGRFGEVLKGAERRSAERKGLLRWSPRVAPFQATLPVPPLLTPQPQSHPDWPGSDYYKQPMEAAFQEILPGLQTEIWGFNGRYPGPTLKVRKNRQIAIERINNLAEPTVTHLHGSFVNALSDGHPVTGEILPGERKVHVHPNRQEALTMWYHDHRHDLTGFHVYMGLAGFCLLEDDFEDNAGLKLPGWDRPNRGYGEYDIPIVIQDRLFNPDGSLHYPSINSGGTLTHGVRGDTILVNGAIQPRMEVANRKYRFRVLNGSNATQYQLAWSSGKPLLHIGSDGGLMPKLQSRNSVRIGPAMRREFIFDFSYLPVGGSVVLRNLLASGTLGEIMRFDVVRSESDTSRLPRRGRLRPMPPLSPANATATRFFEINKSGDFWEFNGEPYDFDRIDAEVRPGATEIWEFENKSGRFHPVHIHLIEFQVLDINGARVPAGDVGPLDIINVPGGSRMRAIMRWPTEAEFEETFPPTWGPKKRWDNLYVFHCHNLEHEDHALMGNIQMGPEIV